MTWTRLSDDFADRPDVIGLSNAALAAHIRALCWSNKHLTDGAVPKRAVRLLVAADDDEDAIVAELTACGLWVADDGTGDYLLDWSEQESSTRVKERREFNADRQRRYRDRVDRHARGDHSMCDSRFCPKASVTRNATRNETRPQRVSNRYPSRPVPSRPKAEGQGQGAAGAASSPSRFAPVDSRLAAQGEEATAEGSDEWNAQRGDFTVTVEDKTT